MSNTPILLNHQNGLQEVDGNVSPVYGSGLNTIMQGNDARTTVQNVLKVNKNPGAGEFSSITAALASISTNTTSNRFIIQVGPGTYVESTITAKAFVNIDGSGDSTIIEASDANTDLIIGTNDSEIANCILKGSTGAGKSLVRVTSTLAGGVYSVLNCLVDTGDRFVTVDSANLAQVTVANVLATRNSSPTIGFYSTGAGIGVISVLGFSAAVFTGQTFGDLFLADTPTAQLLLSGIAIINSGGTVTNAMRCFNGALVQSNLFVSTGAATALKVDNTGSGPTIHLSNLTVLGSTVSDIDIAHPATSGHITGALDTAKSSVDISASVSIAHADPTGTDTGFAVIGEILQGINEQEIANVSKLLRGGITLGHLSGGTLTREGTALTVAVAAGEGFLNNSSGIVREISWTQVNLVITGADTMWVTVNESSVVQLEVSLPMDLSTRIVLGRVIAGPTDIEIIEDVPISMKNSGNCIENALRTVFGSIYASGSTVTEGMADRTLNVTAGRYFMGSSQINLVGGTPVTFIEIIRDGAGDFIPLNVSATVVTNVNYDNNLGVVTAIPAGKFVKHVILADTNEGNDVYVLEYGQALYDSQVDAENGPIPQLPSETGNTLTLIASVIVQQGAANIIIIQDLRPVPSFKGVAGSPVTVHSDLSGLDVDSHMQYLLVNGSRALTGNLNMGSNNIITVGTVDGVVVSLHASRHLPNGLDPITTATAVEITDATNSVGIQNSLARSDHGHAHGNRGGGTLHALATAGVHGFMSSTDKAKIDSLAATSKVALHILGAATPVASLTVTDIIGSQLPWDATRYAGYSAGEVIVFVEVSNRDVVIEVFDAMAVAIIGTITVTAVQGTGVYTFSIVNPLADTYLVLRATKTANGGTSPILHSAVMEFNQ